MRILVGLVLILHGAIHLLGFLQLWGLASVPQLSGRSLVALSPTGERLIGASWLLACLLLIAAGVLWLLRAPSWWVFAGLGVTMSQTLIVLQWSDAKAGTVVNLVIAIPVVVALATARFDRQVQAEVRYLLAAAVEPAATLVQPGDLAGLPVPVRRWLEASGVVGRERVRTVRLQQRGEMRTGPEQPWMPARAEQYFSVAEPGFVWKVDVTMKGLPVVGRDKYADGRGHMLIKAAALVPIADATGPQIDQGTLLRFLGEMIWFPSAALSDYITWESVDARQARATMRYRGVEGSAVFAFDDRGRFLSMTADRYLELEGRWSLERWTVPASEWRVIRGTEIPVKGDVIWKLRTGDFNYYRWEILDVEYNRPQPYPRRVPSRSIQPVATLETVP